MPGSKVADASEGRALPKGTADEAGRAGRARGPATHIALITVFSSLVLLFAVAIASLAMNRSAQDIERGLIERELDRRVGDVLDEQKSVALWDEAVSRIRARDTAWLDSEVGAYLNGGYGHDEVYLLNGSDRLVYSYPHQDAGKADFARVSRIAKLLTAEIRTGRSTGLRKRDTAFLATHGLPKEIVGASRLRWSAHLLEIGGQPVIASAMTVVPTTNMRLASDRPPVLLSIWKLDDARLAAMGKAATIAGLSIGKNTTGARQQVATIDLEADDGTMMGKLEWVPRHPGFSLLSYGLPLLVLGTIWGIYASLAMLRRMIVMSRGLEASERAAIRLANLDALSGLPNRRMFLDTLDGRLVAWRANEGERPLVAYVDIDRFKDINDTLGHDIGDALVRAAGDRLAAALPEGNLLARLGGDEFAIVCLSTDPLAGWKLGRELVAAFAAPVHAAGQDVVISVSVGISIPERATTSSAELMREADIALYRAKEAGRGRAVIFRPEMGEAVERRRKTELDLRAAIAEGQLRLVYQPVLTIEGAPRFNSVEALLRWSHPERGLIPPDEFIPIAETSGQMTVLGEWVLAQALRDSVHWPGLQVAVNLSPVQLRAEGFVRRAARMVADARVHPAQIILEVTESVMMDASGQAGQALRDLREMGFRIALDDFGTGYSSLSYLRQFQFDRLKIDRSFTDGLGEEDKAMAVIEMVVSLGRRLGLEVVAEGIENETQAQLMKAAGCTHLQGWFVARPLEVRDITKMLDTSPRVEPVIRMLRGTAA